MPSRKPNATPGGQSSELDRYAAIIDMVHEVNVETSKEFQTLFNGFYQVRRNEEWRRLYYKYFEQFKIGPIPTYDQIIDTLYDNLRSNKGGTHPVEASFSSKMLAVLDPNMPVLDSHVLENMNLALASYTASPASKLAAAKQVYVTICSRYEVYMETDGCKSAIQAFDTYFPNYAEVFTPVRKIDWFLWKLNRRELIEKGWFEGLIG